MGMPGRARPQEIRGRLHAGDIHRPEPRHVGVRRPIDLPPRENNGGDGSEVPAQAGLGGLAWRGPSTGAEPEPIAGLWGCAFSCVSR